MVDQNTGLPVAEVLGGEVDPECEKRANAFAAELLVPQSWVRSVFEKTENIEVCIEELGKSHGVGKTLAAWQIRNCKGLRLDEDNRIILASMIDGIGFRID